MKLKIISCDTLQKYLDRNDVLLIDLRERCDYEKGHISGAIWADWETLEANIEKLLQKRNFPIHWIILYCDRGNISLLTARDLARHGYPVMSLGGGYERCNKDMHYKNLSSN